MDTFELIIMITIGLGASVLWFQFKSGSEILKKFEDIEEANVLYRDSSATGVISSQKNKEPLLRTHRSVNLLVTKEEFCIKGKTLLASTLQKERLIQRVPKTAIRQVKQVDKSIRIEIQWKTQKMTFYFTTRDPESFIKALR